VRDEALYLVDLLQRARRIETFVAAGREAFDQTLMMQDAVLRNLEVMGEAAKHVSPSTRARYPEVSWRRIAGLRDVLIHAYPRVNLDQVWEVCTGDLPRLRPRLEAILRERGIDPAQIPA
jgi:uncharacterized protein with HEPN domain